jgi:hypothetical protein
LLWAFWEQNAFYAPCNGGCRAFFNKRETELHWLFMEKKFNRSRAPSVSAYQAAVPLWQLAPIEDAHGKPVADFMLLIPRMSLRGPAFAERARREVQQACARFGERIYFADLNLSTGALWVSVEASPGFCGEVARAIRRELPEVLMVGGQLGVETGGMWVFARLRGKTAWFSRIRRRVVRRLLPSRPGSGSR